MIALQEWMPRNCCFVPVTMTKMINMMMMKMTMLSSGRNSPCLITQGALKLWAEPVSHKNTQDDRDYHDQQLDREQIHIIT